MGEIRVQGCTERQICPGLHSIRCVPSSINFTVTVSFNLTMITSGEKFLQVKVIKCPFNSTRQGDIYSNPSLNLKVT